LVINYRLLNFYYQNGEQMKFVSFDLFLNSTRIILKIFIVFSFSAEFNAHWQYTLVFNAGNLASGIYFYVISAGDKQLSRKMILLR